MNETKSIRKTLAENGELKLVEDIHTEEVINFSDFGFTSPKGYIGVTMLNPNSTNFGRGYLTEKEEAFAKNMFLEYQSAFKLILKNIFRIFSGEEEKPLYIRKKEPDFYYQPDERNFDAMVINFKENDNICVVVDFKEAEKSSKVAENLIKLLSGIEVPLSEWEGI